MQKVMLVFLCFIWAFSSCEIPESVTVKGSPAVRLPLGSPFKEDDKLGKYINHDAILEMMGGMDSADTDTVGIYYYKNDPLYADVQTYVVHYPITELKLDLSTYVANAMKVDGDSGSSTQEFTIPPFSGITESQFQMAFPGGLNIKPGLTDTSVVFQPGYDNEPLPLFTISLKDMKKLVREVNGKFVVEMNYESSFAQYLQIYIPAFGIGTESSYASGLQEGDKLIFGGSETRTIYPMRDLRGTRGELDIFVKLTGPCSGKIAPAIDFNWEEAVIDTSGGLGEAASNPLIGSYFIKNQLKDFLGGEGVEFDYVEGFIYVDGIDLTHGATMTMKITEYDRYLVGDVVTGKPLKQHPQPDFPPASNEEFGTNLHALEQSLDDSIFLDEVLNEYDNFTLQYEIKINAMTIKKAELSESGDKVSVDLVFLFPLSFQVSAPPVGNFAGAEQYVKLDLGEAFNVTSDKDLFGRKEGSSDDLLKNLQKVTIFLAEDEGNKDVMDTSSFNVWVNAGTWDDMIRFGERNPSVTIEGDDIPNPFIPDFEILLKKDDGKDHATLKMKPFTAEPVFDFYLTVEVKAEIDETKNF